MNDGDGLTSSEADSMPSSIELRGVRVHNLKSIDVDIPLNQLTVITGVSGSGKSSLAFDTLYAEGQRRYIESFSASARRHLDRLERPDADSIARIPPAVTLRQNAAVSMASRRSTIATVTEIDDLLRILFSRMGTVVCPDCDRAVKQDSASTVTDWITQQPVGLKIQVAFPLSADDETDEPPDISRLLEKGFTRVLMMNDHADAPSTGQMVSMQNSTLSKSSMPADRKGEAFVVVDRVQAGNTSAERITESAETAMQEADGRCVVLAQATTPTEGIQNQAAVGDQDSRPSRHVQIDGEDWRVLHFSSRFDCSSCGRTFAKPEPSTLSFRSPLGACITCRGTGTVTTLDWDKLVPDRSLSLQSGAVVALADDRWKRERKRLLKFAENAGIPVDIPFRDLTDDQITRVFTGGSGTGNPAVSSQEGLEGLFERLDRRKPNSTVREFLKTWREVECCSVCKGTRLCQEALAVRVSSSNGAMSNSESCSIGDVSSKTVDELLSFLSDTTTHFPANQSDSGTRIISSIAERLAFLKSTGLGYLRLNRTMSSLSRGEAQRVAMTSIAGADLVNTLFVIDEPSAGLHSRDVSRVVDTVRSLRDSCNTVVVVEHELDFLNAADHVIDIGPEAGVNGGELVYAGPQDELAGFQASITGRWLAERSASAGNGCNSSKDDATKISQRLPTNWLFLRGATCHTVRECSVDIPLGCLCVVTGVSGAGKSSLIEDVLYPAVCQKLGQPCATDHAGEFSGLAGIDQISSVELIDDQPLAGSRRSNPATWLKVFDEVRRLFAETEDARHRNLTASHFSFNTDSGGRCNKCEGTGRVEIDMQFLADVSMTCPDCNGTRYLPHILEVQWRARTIADVLAMTATEAFSFFRGQPKIQKKLRSLKDVGLDYLTLGQPLSTLSGGEAQRLKLAARLAASTRTGSLLIMNEPTTGLHPADVTRLLECFEGLLSVGHSLIVIEHNLDVIRRADHIIDMGPEAGPAGGQIVVTGSVTDVAACPKSITGQYLRTSPLPG